MSTRPVDKIRIGPRIRRDLGDIDGLARSIREVGLLVVISPDGALIAGRAPRCKAAGDI